MHVQVYEQSFTTIKKPAAALSQMRCLLGRKPICPRLPALHGSLLLPAAQAAPATTLEGAPRSDRLIDLASGTTLPTLWPAGLALPPSDAETRWGGAGLAGRRDDVDVERLEGLALRVCPGGEGNGSCRRRGGCSRGRGSRRRGLYVKEGHPVQSSWVVAAREVPRGCLSRIVVLQSHQIESHLDQPVPAQEEPEAEECLKRSSWGGSVWRTGWAGRVGRSA